MGKWTRRAFLSTGLLVGGGFAVGVALRPGNRTGELSKYVAHDGETLVHTWVKLDGQNQVTAIVPHAEMGQGVGTSLAQMLADELDADWNLVSFEYAPAVSAFSNYPIAKSQLLGPIDLPDAIVPTVDGIMIQTASALDLQITGGSMSVRGSGVYGMRVAGAAVREMLTQAAAEEWGVPVDEVVARESQLIHAESGRTAPFSEFAEAAARLPAPAKPRLKSRDQFRVMGRHVDRQDIPSKVDGTAQFALDVKVPDMLYATALRAPVFGGELERFDATQALQMEGVVDVVELPASEANPFIGKFKASASVAVVAESFWLAKLGLEAVDMTWKETPNEGVTTEAIFEQFDGDIAGGVDRQTDVVAGDLAGALASADRVIEADYRVPFLAHTCMEPLNATARVENGECEIWVGCQSPLGFRKAVADALGFEPEQVTLNNCLMGGGFGRKSRADWAVQAAVLAQKVGRPVQLIWTREEDIRQDYYRPAVLSRFRAALDANGQPSAWENTYVEKMEPVEAPVIPYAVGAQDIGAVSSPTHVPYGAWRSVDHSSHGFFTESFIDELAVAAEQDPVAYRASLLDAHPRLQSVLKKATDEAGWGQPLGPGRGRGVSLQESFGTIVAHVVEVTVDEDEVSVDRVVSAADPGFAVSPDGFAAQIESGIVYGLTAALYGEITIKDGRVEQSNFHDYPALRMSATPEIEVYVINSGHTMGGAGEPSTPGIAPALTNAIAAATGTRIRRLPIAGQSLGGVRVSPA
ncbi:MAG: isoquinoline 1-oxidoreductase [Deltaproteobacteria bacterium]|nr:isoquinoline 1-oxidoreductase [Deltaproteobacteria bacterium]